MPAAYPPLLEHTARVPSMFDQDGADSRTAVGRVRRPGSINSVEYIPNWARTGANTNYRTLNLYNRGQAGAGTTLVATLALTSGVDLTASAAKTITITAANAAVVVGDVLEWVSSATGAGAPETGGLVIVQQNAGS